MSALLDIQFCRASSAVSISQDGMGPRLFDSTVFLSRVPQPGRAGRAQAPSSARSAREISRGNTPRGLARRRRGGASISRTLERSPVAATDASPLASRATSNDDSTRLGWKRLSVSIGRGMIVNETMGNSRLAGICSTVGGEEWNGMEWNGTERMDGWIFLASWQTS